mmetsp:Transcript_11423/g.25183  ORF Transcript_11423/g.25183 Transcript_11423/m.25183 type:complete len:537 (+) Transcript_11423:52-1662(+)
MGDQRDAAVGSDRRLVAVWTPPGQRQVEEDLQALPSLAPANVEKNPPSLAGECTNGRGQGGAAPVAPLGSDGSTSPQSAVAAGRVVSRQLSGGEVRRSSDPTRVPLRVAEPPTPTPARAGLGGPETWNEAWGWGHGSRRARSRPSDPAVGRVPAPPRPPPADGDAPVFRGRARVISKDLVAPRRDSSSSASQDQSRSPSSGRSLSPGYHGRLLTSFTAARRSGSILVGQQQARAHFATIELRQYDEIFRPGGNVVAAVVGDPVLQQNGVTRYIPGWIRYSRGGLYFVIVMLNLGSMYLTWSRSISWGDARANYKWVLEPEHRRIKDPHHPNRRTLHLMEHQLAEFFFVHVEICVVFGIVLWSLWKLRSLVLHPPQDSDLSVLTEDDNHAEWIDVADGIDWWHYATTASAVSFIPRIKMAPSVALDKYYLFLDKRRPGGEGPSCFDRLQAALRLVGVLMISVFLAFVGVIALYLKIGALSDILCHDTGPVTGWSIMDWVLFLGFVNQMAGLINLPYERKEGVLFFLVHRRGCAAAGA